MAWCTSSVAGPCPCSSLPPLKHLNTTNVRICTDLPASRAEMSGNVSTASAQPQHSLSTASALPRQSLSTTPARCTHVGTMRQDGAGSAREGGRPVNAGQGPDAVLEALDPDQQEVARATRGPVC